MLPLDITAIEQRARRLRAEEIRNVPGVMSARMRVYGQLVGNTLLTALTALSAVSEILRPLFSWNPQAFVASRHVSEH